ncbi:hypothetical protein EIP86_010211 [Pleurotus ostreatoroseus]|nr:hypothetical protein EIP86_010211 [Pleurotus ostreatoroseus]
MDLATSLAELMNALGGPHVSPSSLASVCDTPAGRSLVEWMISQAQEPDGQGISITALRQIALEDEELAGCVPLCGACEASTSCSNVGIERKHEVANAGSNPNMPYATPSSLRKQAEHVQAVRELLENQTKVIRGRAEQTKYALITHVKSWLMKQQIGYTTNAEDQRLAAHHDATILQVEKRQLAISQTEHAIPSPKDIEAEVERLQRVLSPLQGKARSLEDRAYCEELRVLSQRIEDSESFRNELSNLLEPRDEDIDQDVMNGPNIEVEVQRAWMLDQYALLRAREDLADQANDRLQFQLLDQFQALNDELKSRTDLTFETECLVNALLEELEEIGEDVQAVQHRRPHASVEQGDRNLLVRQELANTIKELQDYRPEEERPLVLIDDADLESELKAIQERLEESQNEEDQWFSSLASTLSKL